MFLSDYIGVFLFGLFGMGYCVGMCGVFVIVVLCGVMSMGGVVLW